MMEYRWAEQFSEKLGIPLVYVITQWFKYDTKFEPLNDWIYMTAVAKVKGLKNHPGDPIELQLINKDDALKIIDNLLDAVSAKGDLRVRPPMPLHMVLGWSYDKISKDTSKRTAVLDHAVRARLRCPGEKCGHVFFYSLPRKSIHIGHRISQNWNSKNTGVVDVHHPYNLYLSCDTCNTSLSDKYPTEIDELLDDLGTIGDWLMSGLLDEKR